MKSITLWFKSLFGFSQKEINGFIILSILMVLLLVTPFFYPYIFKPKAYNSTEDEKILREIIALSSQKEVIKKKKKKSKWIPNKYKKKKSKKHHITKFGNKQLDVKKPVWKSNYYSKKQIIPIKINTADTTSFKQIKGIGMKLSKRIIAYRQKLGGFNSINQIKEVYGIDSNLINDNKKHFLKIDLTHINHLNVNTATVKELVHHPYISYKQAIAISNYRQQHGDYQSFDDLSKIHLISDSDLERMKDYLVFE